MPHRALAGPRRPRGVALLTAMLLVALIASLAAGVVWQQWQAVQVESAERARAQSQWILGGATDYARLILREDARNGGYDALSEPWATPLAEARLSSFLATDPDRRADQGPEAFLSGEIRDLQSRYNLLNVVAATPEVRNREARTLARVLAAAGLPPGLATQLSQTMRQAVPSMSIASDAAAAGDAVADRPLRPARLRDLRWMGLDEAALRALEPLLTLLPVTTPLNLNTAPREVLAAVLDVDSSTAERLVQARERKPLANLSEARALLPATVELDADRLAVASSWFEVRGRLRLEERIVEEHAVLERRGVDVLTVFRERRAAFAP